MEHDNQLYQIWEVHLKRYGLSARQQKEQTIQPLPGSPSEFLGIQQSQFDKGLRPWQERAPKGLAEEDFERFHEVVSRHYERDTPEWSFSDIQIRQLITFAFPSHTENELHRKKAADMCALIYRYFRLCEPVALLAEDFHTTEKGIKQRLIKIRKIAKKLNLQ